jgi:hypothetical protein
MRSALLVVGLTACATSAPYTATAKGGPRGLHVDEHLDVAHEHDDLARQSGRMPERYGAANDAGVVWLYSYDSAAEHERLASMHRSEAATLQAAFDEACRGRPAADAVTSPLARYAVGGWSTSTGVILYLAPEAGTPADVLAAMKCHRASMMLTANPAMEACALDLPGLLLDARAEGGTITLSMSVRDRQLVPELQRRAAHDVEARASMHAPHPH